MFLRCALAACLGLLTACADEVRPEQNAVSAVQDPPNILLIVADDLGYTDLGSFGGEIPTPNLDRLARAGVRLSNFHTSVSCAPTRAMLMSGTDNHLAGMGTQGSLRTDNQANSPAYQNRLAADVDSVASLLADAGYRNYMSGKWHLGSEAGYLPPDRGFHRSLALMGGGAGHFDDTPLFEPRIKADWRLDGVPWPVPEPFYSSVDITNTLMGFLDEHPDGQPFFAYLAFTAPHWPLQAPDVLLEKYRDAYQMGWDELLSRRMAGAIREGVVPSHAQPVAHTQGVPRWAELSEEQRIGYVARMGAYAAMVDLLDQNVGRLLDYLDRAGLLDETVVVFMSDNGAEGHPVEYTMTRDWVERTFDNTPANIGTISSYVSTGEGWARASAAPFRLSKGRISEGGIRTPAFVHLPAHNIPRVDDAYASVMDLAPTFLELAGAPPSEQHRGRSLLGRLRGDTAPVYGAEEVIAYEVFGRLAVQRGHWKALRMEPPYGTGEWQLYNLANDPGEQEDLSLEQPELRAELIEAWHAYAEEVGVILPDEPVSY